METYWVLRNGSIECQVAPRMAPLVAASEVSVGVLSAGGHHHGRTASVGSDSDVSVARGRLTRRGRVILSAVGLAFAAPLVSAGAVAAASSPPDPVNLVSYTVAAGESLWTIAENHKTPGTDTRDELARIKRLNHLSDSNIFAGQVIYVDSAS